MTVIAIVGLIGAGLYTAGIVALVVAIAKTPPVGQPHARPDRSHWGTDTRLHEQCALIWGLPEAGPEAGFDRIQQAINDDPEGD